MKTMPVGTKGEYSFVVKPEHLAGRLKDSTLPPVLVTPIMVLAMENAALNAIRAFLEPHEIALGTAVDVRHVAATPVGQRVVASATLIETDGSRLILSVDAREEIEEIGRGTHTRSVINREAFETRLDAKRVRSGERHQFDAQLHATPNTS